MKHIPKWLEKSLSRPTKDASEDQPTYPRDANPDDNDLGVELPKDLQDFLADVPVPDIYSDAAEVTVPDMKTPDTDESGGDKPTGFDPYDTVKMHKT